LVVSHSRAARLRRCLESLEQADSRDTLEIIVVDNGSTDGSAQLENDFPKSRFIRLPKNFGLTKALNIGIRAASTEYILLLHDDTEVSPDAVRLLTEVLDANAEAAAACPLLVDERGNPAPQLGTLPPEDNYRPASPGGSPEPVDYPRGAALMVRAFFLRAMRQIDERYGQFGSDADLAQQIHRGSKKILLVPAARVVHHGREGEQAIRKADFFLGRAVWIRKYQGFGPGIGARIGSTIGALLSFRFGEFRYTAAGQKVDGTQP
jgi:GT2 family glycosyltransferase